MPLCHVCCLCMAGPFWHLRICAPRQRSFEISSVPLQHELWKLWNLWWMSWVRVDLETPKSTAICTKSHQGFHTLTSWMNIIARYSMLWLAARQLGLFDFVFACELTAPQSSQWPLLFQALCSSPCRTLHGTPHGTLQIANTVNRQQIPWSATFCHTVVIHVIHVILPYYTFAANEMIPESWFSRSSECSQP